MHFASPESGRDAFHRVRNFAGKEWDAVERVPTGFRSDRRVKRWGDSFRWPIRVLLLLLAPLTLTRTLPGQQPPGTGTAQTKVAADVSRRILSAPI